MNKAKPHYTVYLSVREETDDVQFITEEEQLFSVMDKKEAIMIFERTKNKVDKTVIMRDLYDEELDGEVFE